MTDRINNFQIKISLRPNRTLETSAKMNFSQVIRSSAIMIKTNGAAPAVLVNIIKLETSSTIWPPRGLGKGAYSRVKRACSRISFNRPIWTDSYALNVVSTMFWRRCRLNSIAHLGLRRWMPLQLHSNRPNHLWRNRKASQRLNERAAEEQLIM
jgi:hypothetical protein